MGIICYTPGDSELCVMMMVGLTRGGSYVTLQGF